MGWSEQERAGHLGSVSVHKESKGWDDAKVVQTGQVEVAQVGAPLQAAREILQLLLRQFMAC